LRILLSTGHFLRLLSASNAGKFENEFILQSIRLSSVGHYKLTIRSFIHCASTDCELANDSISISTNQFIYWFDEYKEIYRINKLNGRIRDKEWMFDETLFEVQSTDDLYVS
jgi:hypothetical protein